MNGTTCAASDHPTVVAVGVIHVGVEQVPACADCVLEAITEDVHPVEAYDGGPVEVI